MIGEVYPNFVNDDCLLSARAPSAYPRRRARIGPVMI
jgi:hypothetical protein